MKILFLILFPFLLTAQVWYVSIEADGPTYDGTSWATAYRYLDNVDSWSNDRAEGLDWADVEAGDTIRISGGADSLIYTPNLMYGTLTNESGITIGHSPTAARRYNFIAGNPVIVTNGWEEEHNGRVIFDLDSNNQRRAFTIYGVTNIKFVNLTFRNTRDPVVDVGSTIISVGATQVVADSNVTFDRCTFYTYGAGGTFGVSSSNWTLQNSTVSVVRNNLVNGQDPFGFSSGTGGHTMNNNIIIVRNGYQVLSGNNIGNGVSVTDSSLTDTNLNMATNYHVNNSVWVNGYYMQIASNTSNTFYGAEWVFDTYTQNDSDDVVTTDTSLTDIRGESWNRNILTGALVICAGDTLILTSNFGTAFYGDAWTSGNNPGNGRAYTIEGAGTPAGDSLKWFMGGPHRDIIQVSNIGMQADTVTGGTSKYPRKPFTISNNLILDPVAGGAQWNALIYNYGWSYTPPIEFRIYNNIIATAKINAPGILGLGRLDTKVLNTVKLFNNTFISRGGFLTEWSVDSIISRNNIMIADTTISYFYNLDPGHTYRGIDYNFYAEKGGVPTDENFSLYNGNWKTWTEWVALPADANSTTANSTSVTFADKFGEEKADYYTESGRDIGENLWDDYPYLRTDALGNPRPETGAWDMGALEAMVDSTPNAFTYFEDITNAELNTLCFAQTGDLLDFDSAYAHIDRGQYNVNGNPPWKDSDEWTMVFPNDDIYLRDTSSSEYSTSKSIILTVGGRSETWTFTTKAAPSLAVILRASDGRLPIQPNARMIFVKTSSYVPPAGEPDTTPPNPPTSFATSGVLSTQFQTNWTNPTASDLDSIRYYEGSSSDTATMSWIVSLSATTGYLRAGRTPETKYYCAVKAVDDSGNVSYFSNIDSATTLATEEGQPLQNLKMAYLKQSTATHLFDHGDVGEEGTTSMPLEMTAYNEANALAGYNAGSITKIEPDYPACGDMIWDWWAVFWNKDQFGCDAEYIVNDWLTDTTYSIFQVTYGFACGALDYYGWYSSASDTTNWPTSLIGNNFKYYTRQMVYVMEQYPDKYFVLWTLYPPGTDYTDSVGMRMASQFGTWMTDTLAAGNDSYGVFPDNVMIFDIRTELDSSYYLPDSYADSPQDPHPNAAAASYIAPIYIQQVFDNARAYRRPE